MEVKSEALQMEERQKNQIYHENIKQDIMNQNEVILAKMRQNKTKFLKMTVEICRPSGIYGTYRYI